MEENENENDGMSEPLKRILGIMGERGARRAKIDKEIEEATSSSVMGTSSDISEDMQFFIDAIANSTKLQTGALLFLSSAMIGPMDLIQNNSDPEGGELLKMHALSLVSCDARCSCSACQRDGGSREGSILIGDMLMMAGIAGVKSVLFNRLRKIHATAEMCKPYMGKEAFTGPSPEQVEELLEGTQMIADCMKSMGIGMTEESIGKLRLTAGLASLKEYVADRRAAEAAHNEQGGPAK